MSDTKIIPRGQWVLVKPKEQAKETSEGLVIPDSVEKEQKAQGEVIKIGKDVIGLNVGDVVLYGKFAGEEVQLENKQDQKDRVDYILLPDEEIIAIIEE